MINELIDAYPKFLKRMKQGPSSAMFRRLLDKIYSEAPLKDILSETICELCYDRSILKANGLLSDATQPTSVKKDGKPKPKPNKPQPRNVANTKRPKCKVRPARKAR